MACETVDKNLDCSSGVKKEPSLEYQFATSTTLHGIGRVAESSGFRGKILWVLALLFAGGFYVSVTVDRIQAYLNYEANTNVIIEFNKTLAFPAVTICNYNRFMEYRIAEKDKEYVSRLLQVDEYLFEEYSEYDYSQSFDFTEDFDDFNYTLFALSTGFLLNDSLRQCTWKGAKCDASNFSSFYSPTYGQCYTFNALGEPGKYTQSRQGIGNGLQLLIDIQQSEYTETLESGHAEAGLKFAIHPPDELPILDTMGLSAGPGLHTYASMRLVRHINLPKPWGVCSKEKAEKSRKYNRNTCLRNCRRDATITRCHCQPLGYEVAYYYTDSFEPIRHCDFVDFPCVKAALVEHRASSSGFDCVCPVACDYLTYGTTLSTATYPSQSVTEAALQSLSESVTGSALYNIEYLKENLVYLDVYYTDLSTITYHQVEALPFTALLGDLGGQLGLFLGASVLTGVELLDYITKRLQLLVKTMKSRKKGTKRNLIHVGQ